MPSLFDVLSGRQIDPEINEQYEEQANSLIEKDYKGLTPNPFLPRPATGNPSIERAYDVVSRRFPKEMVGVKMEPDWSPEMYSSILGRVGLHEPDTIRINALHAALAHQPTIDETGVHELEHVKQFKDPIYTQHMLSEMALPYEKRDHELKAAKAAARFANERPSMKKDEIFPNIYSDVFTELQNSPTVMSLIDLLNGKK